MTTVSMSTGSSMDILWCGVKSKRKERFAIDQRPASVSVDRGHHQLKTSFEADEGIPEVNMDLSGMETFSLLINRGRQGFGFTVFGSSPVQVGRVDEGSPAFVAGLRKHDFIVRINCQNVSRSMAESVARIVRETESALRLEVQRSPVVDYRMVSPNWLPYIDEPPRIPVVESTFSHAITPRQQLCPVNVKPLVPPRRPLTPLVNNQMSQRFDFFNNMDKLSSCSFESDKKSSIVISEVTPKSFLRRGPSILRSKKAPMPLPVEGEGHQSVEAVQTSNDSVVEGDEQSCVSDCKDIYIEASPATDDKKMSSYEQFQWPAIQALISCEEDFVLQMQTGVQRFLDPLKEAFLSPQQQWTVFHNLEEIISFSQFYVQELHQMASAASSDQSTQRQPPSEYEGNDLMSLEGRLSIGSLVSVYLAKIDAFCMAYESYCPGVMDALHFLASLKKSNPELQSYLRKSSNQDSDGFSISNFLQKPIEHIKELVLTFQKILCYMSTTTTEYVQLKRIVQSMRCCCSTINTTHVQRCNSSMSSLSSIESAPMKSFSSSSSSSNSAAASAAASVATVASSVVSSIDSEVLEIQSRLIFPENVRTFHLATASHHMIYSGRLTLVEDGSSTPLFVVLLSDLLVLTRPDPVGDTLCVLEEPLLLHNVVGCNFSCANISEFMMSVETPLKSLQSSWTPRSLVFRAPSVEMKCTWKNILEQRITASKAQREITISNRRIDKII